MAVLLVLGLSSLALAKPVSEEITRLLPRELGAFRQANSVRPTEKLAKDGVAVEYASTDGVLLLVEL
ncbi:MAG TPA: hypothetical protein VFH31_08540, partial [Pyrinomonadaceae bacterium]|nr:hypothetical protein [Pyrinomonadaceae bacterium]